MWPLLLWEMLWKEEPENFGGRRYAFVSLCGHLCKRWDIRKDVKIVLMRDSRSFVFPLLDDMDSVVGPDPVAPRSRWRRFVCWIKKLFGKPIIDPVEMPPIHEETVRLEEWYMHAGPFYHSTRVGYGPESNVLAWTGMKSVPR